MVRINGQTELRDIMHLRDVDTLERVHREIGERLRMLRRDEEIKPIAPGDPVQFVRNGNLIRGTVLRIRYEEAWVKDFQGVVYTMAPEYLERRPNSAGEVVHPPINSPAERRRA
jgi:hypothetical protein